MLNQLSKKIVIKMSKQLLEILRSTYKTPSPNNRPNLLSVLSRIPSIPRYASKWSETKVSYLHQDDLATLPTHLHDHPKPMRAGTLALNHAL